MLRSDPLITGEEYHIFNRGAHKDPIFFDEVDYRRFSLLLFLSNSSEKLHLTNLMYAYKGRSSLEIFKEVEVDKALVDVFAYALMPNHFHLVLRQKVDGGITSFMKKLATGYAMYFNAKHDHSGVLFQGRFKSKLIDNEAYFRYIYSYVHLNPLDLHSPGWKERGLSDTNQAREFMHKYPYSSFQDYLGGVRP